MPESRWGIKLRLMAAARVARYKFPSLWGTMGNSAENHISLESDESTLLTARSKRGTSAISDRFSRTGLPRVRTAEASCSYFEAFGKITPCNRFFRLPQGNWIRRSGMCKNLIPGGGVGSFPVGGESAVVNFRVVPQVLRKSERKRNETLNGAKSNSCPKSATMIVR